MPAVGAPKGRHATAPLPRILSNPLAGLCRGRRGSWSVHATVDEPIELLCAFVAHYLALGADEVILYLDAPEPAQVAVLGSVPRVRIVECGDDYWSKCRTSKFRRPDAHVERQRINADAAYRRCRSRWFLFCDADEYLALLPSDTTAETSVAAILERADTAGKFLRVGVRERIFERDAPTRSIFSDLFRAPMQGPQALFDRIYGDMATFLHSGLTGHLVGKSFVRTGLLVRIWQHEPVPRGIGSRFAQFVAAYRQVPFVDGMSLLHFDGLTPYHYRLKLLRKVMRDLARPDLLLGNEGRGRGRRKQIAAVFDGRGDPDATAMLDRLQMLEPEQIEMLAHAGALLRHDLHIEEAARALFAQASLDFDPSAFDARLMARHSMARDALSYGTPA